jgi:hypothetical protein
MSGGAIAVAPAIVLIPVAAAAAAAVVGAGLAAALVIRAAQAGTEATGRALEQLANEMERQAKAQDDREIQARLWGLAAGAVVQTNQELRLLVGRAEQAGARVRLPESFDLTGHGLADVRGWVTRTQEALAAARPEVERAEAEREQRALLAYVPTPAGGSLTAAELLADFAKTLAYRYQPVPPVPGVDKGRVRAEIDEILARLDVDATAAQREDVVLAAARTAKQTDFGASRTYLEALASKVDDDVNPKAAGRREAAGWLAALEHPVVAEAIEETAPPLPPHLRAIDRLRAVVRGDAELTDDDRGDALNALAWAQQQVERRRLLEVMAEIFADLGYSVTAGMQDDHLARLCVAREAWRGGHSADVWIGEAGEVRWRLVELVQDAGAAGSRCEDINQGVRVVGEKLAQRGFDAEVQVPAVPVEPLQRHDGRRPPVEYQDAAPMARTRLFEDEEENP